MRTMNCLMRRYFDVGGLVLLLLAAVTGAGATLAAAADESGAWRSHQLRFNYLSPEPIYSCQGLKDTLLRLLKQSGAGQQISVVPGPCVRGYGSPEKLIYAELKFSTLVPAASAGAGSEGEAAAGSWHTVTIGAHDPVLRGGDCEVVEQFKDKVLPLFATRNVKANLNCIPFQTTGRLFSLSFEVFAPSDVTLPGGRTKP